MLIGINAEDLRVGDVVRTTSGVSGTVVKCLGFQQQLNMMAFHLDCMGDQVLLLRVLEIVELLYRPRQEGRTEQDMLDEIFALASSFPGRMWPMSEESRRALGERLSRLREGIETYELGKPKKPQRNESLIDRHMTP